MELERDLRAFIGDSFIFDETPLLGDTSLTQTGIIDSLGVLELVLFLEERCGIKVSEAETLPENLDTVDNIVRFVEAKLPSGTEGAAESYDQHNAAA